MCKFKRTVTFCSLLVIVGLLFVAPTAPILAMPASPRILTRVQPDGTKIKLRLRGDENMHWMETLAGYIVLKDKKDGFWKYTLPKKDKWGFDVIKDAKVGIADPVKLKLKKRHLPDPKLKPKRKRFGPVKK